MKKVCWLGMTTLSLLPAIVQAEHPEAAVKTTPNLAVPYLASNTATPGTGISFTLNARVRNTGGLTSEATALRYLLSKDATISEADTELAADHIPPLAPSTTSNQNALVQIATPGVYYVGACVLPVTGENLIGNNCSKGVLVVVSAPVKLTVSKTGDGKGIVTSVPAGINCGTDCDEWVSPNAKVALKTKAAPGSSFVGWSGGGCSGVLPCTVTMTATKSVKARFLIQIRNSLGMTFTPIPAGTFTMGSPTDEPGRSPNETQHQVTLTQPFYMQTTEVTQGQWQAVMGSNPSYFSSCGLTCPVEQVSWNYIQGFITAINALGQGTYRLPTEAEWEYAARAGTTTAWSFGSNESNLDNYAWYYSNSGGTTHPVAQKLPNPWGLYDVHGNVWEWVQDWYGDYPTGSVTNPTGPSSGSYRVIRGSGWSNGRSDLRSAYRRSENPVNSSYAMGFRLLRAYP